MVSLSTRPAYPISSFTQADIEANKVLFTHSGCLSGGFSLQLSDGLNSVARRQFPVEVTQLTLEEMANKELTVFPGTEVPITANNLLVNIVKIVVIF